MGSTLEEVVSSEIYPHDLILHSNVQSDFDKKFYVELRLATEMTIQII